MSDLSQAEADALMRMPKRSKDNTVHRLPGLGERVNIPLESTDGTEAFFLDLSRGRIDIQRRTYQNRARSIVVLARLDFGSPHRNPDGQEVGVPHIHYYREGFGAKWAFPVPAGVFTDTTDYVKTLEEFMAHCAIVDPPVLKESLL